MYIPSPADQWLQAGLLEDEHAELAYILRNIDITQRKVRSYFETIIHFVSRDIEEDLGRNPELEEFRKRLHAYLYIKRAGILEWAMNGVHNRNRTEEERAMDLIEQELNRLWLQRLDENE